MKNSAQMRQRGRRLFEEAFRSVDGLSAVPFCGFAQANKIRKNNAVTVLKFRGPPPQNLELANLPCMCFHQSSRKAPNMRFFSPMPLEFQFLSSTGSRRQHQATPAKPHIGGAAPAPFLFR